MWLSLLATIPALTEKRMELHRCSTSNLYRKVREIERYRKREKVSKKNKRVEERKRKKDGEGKRESGREGERNKREKQ